MAPGLKSISALAVTMLTFISAPPARADYVQHPGYYYRPVSHYTTDSDCDDSDSDVVVHHVHQVPHPYGNGIKSVTTVNKGHEYDHGPRYRQGSGSTEYKHVVMHGGHPDDNGYY